jgi:polyhydroxyalkanoate synthesis regulator phasin
LREIIAGLVSDTQNQGRYFKSIQLEAEQERKNTDVLQNVTFGHQKTIQEKENQIMQLNESVKNIDRQLKQAV